jgi:hypothetical protein
VKILFLDIDGVLNGHEWDDEAKSCNIRRECVKHLNRVVRETRCHLVLSSAWRYIVHGGDMTLRGFGYMLRTHGLIAEWVGSTRLIVGLTRKDDETVDPLDLKEDERARQCRDWLDWWEDSAREGRVVAVTRYAAVDDEDHQFAAQGIPAVITDGKVGLTAADAGRLIAILEAA